MRRDLARCTAARKRVEHDVSDSASGLDAPLRDFFWERGEVGLWIGLRRNRPDGSQVARYAEGVIVRGPRRSRGRDVVDDSMAGGLRIGLPVLRPGVRDDASLDGRRILNANAFVILQAEALVALLHLFLHRE